MVFGFGLEHPAPPPWRAWFQAWRVYLPDLGPQPALRWKALGCYARAMQLAGGLFISAGEPSGDLHAANLLLALQRQRPALQARGLGGPRLAAAGMTLHHDLASNAVMGLFPVIAALPRLRRVFRDAVRHFDEQRPDALLLVDYPGFNLRLAAEAKKRGIPVIWYIAPKVWAWARWRVKRIAQCVDQLLVILPFEEAWFRAVGLQTVHVGSPVVDHWFNNPPDAARVSALRAGAPFCVALFPGSRPHVVRNLLPVFLDAAARFEQAWCAQQRSAAMGTSAANASTATATDMRPRFLVSQSGAAGADLIAAASARGLRVEACTGSALELMHAADLSLAASGTVTLELALSGKPFVVGYRLSAPIWPIAKLLVKVPHIAPVNLVAEARVVPEHVSVRSFAAAAADDLLRLSSGAARERCSADLVEVARRLGPPGTAERAAREVLRFLDSHPSKQT